jgi:hypothetical protein
VDSATKRKVLVKALEIVGDRQRLARQIHARPIMIDSWLAGLTPIPDHVFLGTVDIVLGRDETTAAMQPGNPTKVPATRDG